MSANKVYCFYSLLFANLLFANLLFASLLVYHLILNYLGNKPLIARKSFSFVCVTTFILSFQICLYQKGCVTYSEKKNFFFLMGVVSKVG